MKVLISAYACEPRKGSEPGVGWQLARQIAEFAKVWVITRSNNRDSLEREMRMMSLPNLHFVYYDLPKWLSFWKKEARGLHLYYLLWQIGIVRIAWRLHRQLKFDIVHHLTFGNMWLPTFLTFLDIPFIWGPIGGGETVPVQFRTNYTIKARLQEYLRDLIVSSFKFNSLLMHICRTASSIIVKTAETQKTIPTPWRTKTIRMIETGVDPSCDSAESNRVYDNRVQVLSVGRLIHLKGFDMAIAAFARAFRDDENAQLIIIGDGPEKVRLLQICLRESVEKKVKIMGYLDNESVLEYMRNSHILLHPSLKDGGAWVLFEAMLNALPVVCLDIAGPADIVDSESGVKIEPTCPQKVIADLADAMVALAHQPHMRKEIGHAGRRRVLTKYTWKQKGALIRDIYRTVLQHENSLYS